MVDAALNLSVQLPAPPVSAPAAGSAASADRAASPNPRPRTSSSENQADKHFAKALDDARDRGKREERPKSKQDDQQPAAAPVQSQQEIQQNRLKPLKADKDTQNTSLEGEEVLPTDPEALAAWLVDKFPQAQAAGVADSATSPKDIFAELVALLQNASSGNVLAGSSSTTGTSGTQASDLASASAALSGVLQRLQDKLDTLEIKADGVDALSLSKALATDAALTTSPALTTINKLLNNFAQLVPTAPANDIALPLPAASAVSPAPVPTTLATLPATTPATDPLALLVVNTLAASPVPEVLPKADTDQQAPAPVSAPLNAAFAEAIDALAQKVEEGNKKSDALNAFQPEQFSGKDAKPGVQAPEVSSLPAPSPTPAATTQTEVKTVPINAGAIPALSADADAQGDSDTSGDDSSQQALSQSSLPAHSNAGTAKSDAPAPSFARMLAEAQTQNLADQVVAHVKAVAKNGESRIQIQLNPEELGKLEIRINVVEGRATMHITADNPKTLTMLQSDVDQLGQLLRKVGLEADAGSLSFNLRDEGQPGQQQQGQGRAYRGQTVDVLEETLNQTAARAYTLQSADGLDIHI